MLFVELFNQILKDLMSSFISVIISSLAVAEVSCSYCVSPFFGDSAC